MDADVSTSMKQMNQRVNGMSPCRAESGDVVVETDNPDAFVKEIDERRALSS
jgi:hypothetical protein